MIVPTIRRMEEADHPALWDLLGRTGSWIGRGARFNPDRSLVALHHGKMVGFVTTWQDGQPYAWVDGLTVDLPYLNSGVGFWLVQALCRMLMGQGIGWVRCTVSSEQVVRLAQSVSDYSVTTYPGYSLMEFKKRGLPCHLS